MKYNIGDIFYLIDPKYPNWRGKRLEVIELPQLPHTLDFCQYRILDEIKPDKNGRNGFSAGRIFSKDPLEKWTSIDPKINCPEYMKELL